jgi:multidrug resistance efflux pump
MEANMLRTMTALSLGLLLAGAAGSGAALAQSPVTLGIARTGVVKSVAVSNGAHVAAGQALLTLDCAPLEKDIDARAANLAAAEAAYERVANGPRPEEVAIGEADVGVSQVRAEEAKASLDRANGLERAQRLVAERNARVADAELISARKKLALLKARSREEDIAEAKARLDSAVALLDEGKTELDQCTLRAPAAGRVELLATVGELVSIYAPAPLVQFVPDAIHRAAGYQVDESRSSRLSEEAQRPPH